MMKAMVARPFSINFDESTVNRKSLLVVDSCYVNEQCLVERRMYTCMEMEEGISGLEVADTVCTSLERDGGDLQILVVHASDGCSAILGKVKGAITILRQRIPTIPDWGGCTDHDLANLLKGGTKELCPFLTNIFSCTFGCLYKHPMHKKRQFENIEEWVGGEIRSVPKFLDVRFRVIERCCNWFETQDCALYTYFGDMKDKVEAGEYEASETEMMVLEKYIGNYLEVRLSNCFILEVAKPVMELISYFESSKIRIQHKEDK
jgi:hypothetical protein